MRVVLTRRASVRVLYENSLSFIRLLDDHRPFYKVGSICVISSDDFLTVVKSISVNSFDLNHLAYYVVGDRFPRPSQDANSMISFSSAPFPSPSPSIILILSRILHCQAAKVESAIAEGGASRFRYGFCEASAQKRLCEIWGQPSGIWGRDFRFAEKGRMWDSKWLSGLSV